MNEFNNIITLNADEMILLKKLSNLIKETPVNNETLFCSESKETSKKMPDRLKTIIEHFVKYGSEEGFLLIKTDFDSDEIPNTPPDNNSRVGETTVLSKIQSMIVNYKSDMICYEAEGCGRLFQDVVPVKKMETEQTSASSKVVLELHTEQAFSNLKPDVLCLACLRGDLNAQTYVLPIKKILEKLSNEEIEMLYEPLWMIGVDLSFKLNEIEFVEGELRGPIPILNGTKEDPILVFDQDLMTGITDKANLMIKRLIDIYHTSKIGHNLKSGEIILIDNMRATHGRSSFTPRYDGNDRFLIRCFGTFDFKKSEYARLNNSRIIMAKYS
jgi:hypothetical protein